MALLGTGIDYPKRLERLTNVAGWLLIVVVFTLPLHLISLIPNRYWFTQIPLAVGLLSFCFASQSLEEHVTAVEATLARGESEGRAAVQMLVSRDANKLSFEQIRSRSIRIGIEKKRLTTRL